MGIRCSEKSVPRETVRHHSAGLVMPNKLDRNRKNTPGTDFSVFTAHSWRTLIVLIQRPVIVWNLRSRHVRGRTVDILALKYRHHRCCAAYPKTSLG